MEAKMSENIKILGLDKKIETTLINNNIKTIDDLWNNKRKELKKLGLKDSEINHIIVHMQLNGIDLNKKSYDKNEKRR